MSENLDLTQKGDIMSIRVGDFVSVSYSDQRNAWIARWTDPKTKKCVKRQMSRAVKTQAEAIRLAIQYDAEVSKQRDIPRLKGGELAGLNISDAFEQAINITSGNDRTKKQHKQATNRFFAWLVEHMPNVTYWKDVTPSVIKHYHNHLIALGNAPDTIRLSLFPIGLTSRHWSNEDPSNYRDVYKAARIKIEKRLKKDIPVLDRCQIKAVLVQYRNLCPTLYPIVMFRALMGMRCYEAAFLTYNDIDLNNGTVKLSDNDYRDLKNAPSERTLPMPLAIIEHLRQNKVRPLHGNTPMFTNNKGEPWKKMALDKCFTRSGKLVGTLRIQSRYWRSGLNPIPDDFRTNHLRHSFQTLCVLIGIENHLIERFVGHEIPGVGAKYYQKIHTEHFREKVVVPFERFFDSEQSGNIFGNSIYG